MTRRLLCAGEVVVDLVLAVPALPARGGDVLATTVDSQPGGAVNVMAAARRQGIAVSYAGLLGTGPMAARATAALRGEGIDLALPARPDRDTATIVTLVEPDGERTFVTTLGAEADLTDDDLAAVEVRPDDVVHVSGYGLAYPRNGPCLARWVPTLPGTVTVVLDPGPLAAGIPAQVLAPVLARTDWVTATVAEARAMVGGAHTGTDPDRLAVALRQRVRDVAVVRDGERGASFAAYDGEVGRADAFRVDAVDRNGAGDAHTGSLIAAISHATGRPDVGAAVRRANAAAAFAVTRRGPATAPTTTELDRFIDERASRPRSNG